MENAQTITVEIVNNLVAQLGDIVLETKNKILGNNKKSAGVANNANNYCLWVDGIYPL